VIVCAKYSTCPYKDCLSVLNNTINKVSNAQTCHADITLTGSLLLNLNGNNLLQCLPNMEVSIVFSKLHINKKYTSDIRSKKR